MMGSTTASQSHARFHEVLLSTILLGLRLQLNMNLCLSGEEHVRVNLAGNINHHTQDRHKGDYHPAHGPGRKDVIGSLHKSRVHTGSPTAKELINVDREEVEEDGEPDNANPCVRESTMPSFSLVLAEGKGWPSPVSRLTGAS